MFRTKRFQSIQVLEPAILDRGAGYKRALQKSTTGSGFRLRGKNSGHPVIRGPAFEVTQFYCTPQLDGS